MMSKNTTCNKKAVSFCSEESDSNKIHYIDSSLSLVGQGNASQLWFTPIELRRIQIRAYKLSHDLKSNAFNKKLLEIKHNGDTSRGLEYYSNQDFQQAAKLRRSKSRTAIVTWSRTQTALYQNRSNSMWCQEQRIIDELVISYTYSSICEDAIQYAINQAQKDRNFVLQNEIDEKSMVLMKTMPMSTETQKSSVLLSQEEETSSSSSLSSSSSNRKRKSTHTMDNNDCYSTSKTNNMIRPPQKQVYFRKRQFAAVAC